MGGWPVARVESERGEFVLRERTENRTASTTLELRLNGVFVMDTRGDVERAGAGPRGAGGARGAGQRAGRRARSRVHPRRGAGRPARTTSGRRRDRARAGRVVARDGTVPHGPALLGDPRRGDQDQRRRRRHRGGRGTTFDLVLLDVDNGPAYLVHDANSALYGLGALLGRRTRRAMRPAGLCVIWSAAPLRPGPARRAGPRCRQRRGDGARTSTCGPGRAVLAPPRAGTFEGVNDSPASTASSTTPWVRSGSRRMRCGGRRPSAPSRTSRSAGGRSSRAHPRAGPHQGRRRADQRRLGALTAERPTPSRGDAGGRRGRARRPVPDRRLPDRLGHLDQHERQRGHRHPRSAPGRRRAPQRPRQRLAVLQRRLPLGDPRRRRARHPRPARRHRAPCTRRSSPRAPSSPTPSSPAART